jgi:hypothetical protein
MGQVEIARPWRKGPSWTGWNERCGPSERNPRLQRPPGRPLQLCASTSARSSSTTVMTPNWLRLPCLTLEGIGFTSRCMSDRAAASQPGGLLSNARHRLGRPYMFASGINLREFITVGYRHRPPPRSAVPG